MYEIAAGLAALTTVIGISVYLNVRDRDVEWHRFRAKGNRRLIDGTYASGRLMRRYVDGDWQYRRESPFEGHAEAGS